MNPFVRKMVNHKLNHLNETELIQLARQYQINLTSEQARKIIKIFRKEPIDIGNQEQINRLLKQIGKVTNKNIEYELRRLFASII